MALASSQSVLTLDAARTTMAAAPFLGGTDGPNLRCEVCREGVYVAGEPRLNTPFPSQSLPPDRLTPGFQHHQLEIVKDLPPEVKVGVIAPHFQQPGGGIQYYFPGGMKRWIDDGYIRVL